MAKKEKERLERRLDRLLAEKMELEYRFQELESVYAHEKGQREEILRLHENTRRLKHDMKNHIMVITSYLQENRIEEARHYLSRVLDELNQIYTYVETGNSVMNYVLNQKLEKAYRKGIRKSKISHSRRWRVWILCRCCRIFWTMPLSICMYRLQTEARRVTKRSLGRGRRWSCGSAPAGGMK